MGMEHLVSFAAAAPAWTAISSLLAQHGFPAVPCMIDGQFVDPDDAVPDSWRELRLSTPQGMVTLRRDSDGLRAVTWGNADASLRQAWNAVAWAAAHAGTGRVDALPAADFRRQADLPPALAARLPGPG